MSGGKNIQYQAPAVPKFLQQFKQKTGMKSGPTLQDKFATNDQGPVDSDPERSDEEGPVVVVLKPGDLTQEEADKILGKKRKLDDSDDDESGKIKFRQPKKKKDGSEAEKSESKPADASSEKKSKKEKKNKRPANGPKNLSLLSFEEDEDR